MLSVDMAGNILYDFLGQLGVACTPDYCDRQIAAMPFKSLFGLSKLLQTYGVETCAYRVADKSQLSMLPVPFIAVTDAGMVIVTSVTDANVAYLTQGVEERMERGKWADAWSGVALCGFPKEDACEPDYAAHRRIMFLAKARDKGMVIGALLLFVYLFVSNHVYAHVSTVLLTVFNLAGIYFTCLLVQKSLKIHSHAADEVCKVLQEGGCDSILDTQASKLLGFFGWSEIGFTYFSVSLLALLIFPQSISSLALFNVCCLPYTLWSIWYQRFRAGAWCTLCVSVQCTLWCLFFCYLGGGWLRGAWHIGIDTVVLGVTYLTVLLVLNKILPKFENEKG